MLYSHVLEHANINKFLQKTKNPSILLLFPFLYAPKCPTPRTTSARHPLPRPSARSSQPPAVTRAHSLRHLAVTAGAPRHLAVIASVLSAPAAARAPLPTPQSFTSAFVTAAKACFRPHAPHFPPVLLATPAAAPHAPAYPPSLHPSQPLSNIIFSELT